MFISRYFIIFDVRANGVNFSSWLLLLYRNSKDLYILVFHPATLPNSLMSSRFLAVSLCCYRYNTCKDWPFSSLLPPLFPFGFLWTGLPELCGVKVVIAGVLVFFLILEELLQAFHHWARCQLSAFHRMAFVMFMYAPSMPLSGEFLS